MAHITVEEAERMVEKIRAEMSDDERAHDDEDDLHRRVLEAIAAGQGDARSLAEIALRTADNDAALVGMSTLTS